MVPHRYATKVNQLVYVSDMSNPSHYQTNKSQFADDAGLTSRNLKMMPAVSKNIDLVAEYLQRDIDKPARWCAKWKIKLNPEKQESEYSPSPKLQ